jgi:hypothetical protein
MQEQLEKPRRKLDDLFSSKEHRCILVLVFDLSTKKFCAVFRIDYGYGITKMLTMELYLELANIFKRLTEHIFL